MKSVRCFWWLVLLSVSALYGCGGGSSNDQNVTPPPRASTASVKLSTQGAGSNLSGIQLTVDLPDGVTIKAAADGTPESGVVKLSGVAPADATLAARYLPAAGNSPGQVTILLASTSSFSAGEFVTISCDVAAGKTLTTTMLTFTGYRPVDGQGRSVLAEYPAVQAVVAGS